MTTTDVAVAGRSCKALLDTGSQVTTITDEFVSTHPQLQFQTLQKTDINIQGAGGQSVPHHGYILLTVQVLGEEVKDVPTLVVPVTDFRHTTPLLIGTNVILAVRNALHKKFGRGLMSKTKKKSPLWFSAFQCINSDGTDIARTNGEIGRLRFIGRHPVKVRPGTEVTVFTQAPKSTRGRTIAALVEGTDNKGTLKVGRMLTEVRSGKTPVRLYNFSHQVVTLRRNTVLATLSCVQVSSPSTQYTQGTEEAISCEQMMVDEGTLPDVDLPDLAPNHMKAMQDLLRQNADVFSTHSLDIGSTTTVEHEIPLSDPTPFRMPYRRIPPAEFQEVREHIEELQKANIIKPSQGPFASAIVIVRKKDGSIRLCVDYRKLNSKTVRDAYPLPRIDEALDALGKAKYFSCLDLTSGYLQVKVAEKDQPKTAFTTPMGLFEYTRMPFGLVNAPATFQRLMSTVFSDMNFESILLYLDDVIVYSSTVEEHISRLSQVFQRLRQHNLKLKPSKCHFLQRSVQYLGHIVSADGIATNPEKIEAIAAWPVPKCKKDVRGFLGITGYYRKFIYNYAQIARPLFALIGGKRGIKDPPFVWTDECEVAFRTLISKLTSAPILAYADYELPFLVQTDASIQGLGAVLIQQQEGQERVVAYASRSLSPSEAKYPAHKLEFRALHWAITVKFRDYLYGHTVTAITDNNPLTYVLKSAKLDAHSHRWVSDLSLFNLDMQYRPGKSNGNADALSRISQQYIG